MPAGPRRTSQAPPTVAPHAREPAVVGPSALSALLPDWRWEEVCAAHAQVAEGSGPALACCAGEPRCATCAPCVALSRARAVHARSTSTGASASLLDLWPPWTHNAWVVKPGAASCGMGVFVATRWAQLVHRPSGPGGRVAQAYVARPLLLRGFK